MSRSPHGSWTELEQRSRDVGQLRLARSTSTSDERAFRQPDKHNTARGAAVTDQPREAFKWLKWDLTGKRASVHLAMGLAGYCDASSGPLIPYIQAYYGISYTVVSLLFVGQMVGFLAAAFSNVHLTARFGLGKVIAAGAVIQTVGFVFLIPAFPFPVMPIAYGVIGFGLALQHAQANTYIASLPNPDHKFAFLHAAYGVGAVVAPLAATGLVGSGVRFSYFYAVSLGIALVNAAFLLHSFKFSFRLGKPADDGPSTEEIALDQVDRPADRSAEPASEVSAPDERRSVLAQTLRGTALWLFACFMLLYVGAEVSQGGWIVTFIIDNRNGGSSSGFISTGFWGGLLVGRLALTWVNVRVGPRVLLVYLALSIALELTVMLTKNLIGNAVAVALVGVLMGPSYSVMMALATKVIPRKLHASSIGFIAAFGELGAAIFPFVSGSLAQKYSPAALNPVMITLLGLQAATWVFVPIPKRKTL